MNVAAGKAVKTPLEIQFDALKARYPGAVLQDGAGAVVVSVPHVRLPKGWNKKETSVHFLIPVAFPHANPDCFNTEADLRLANGALPQNSTEQPMPLIGSTLWFSWHLQGGWKPNRDNLLTWMAVIERRFESLT
ncbi:MAG TPA: E2/UBC family protein [Allosphingosinicella sp.]|jgi:hypothetical protein